MKLNLQMHLVNASYYKDLENALRDPVRHKTAVAAEWYAKYDYLVEVSSF